MFSDKKEIDVPMEERLLIYPEQRQKLFLNMVENYKIFCPNIKLLYAALNYDSELKIEYLVIFEGVRKGKNFILWDSPFIYTNRAIPAYRYAVRNNLFKEFFDMCVSRFCQMEKSRFYDFINSNLCGLSTEKDDPLYWKKPENAHALMKGMSSMGLMYIPEGFRNTGRRKVD